MLVLGNEVEVESDQVKTNGGQITATATGSKKNVEVSVPEAIQVASSAGATSVPESKENPVSAAPEFEYAFTPLNFR